jgi:hypothetical protein
LKTYAITSSRGGIWSMSLYESDDVVAFHCDVVQHTLLHDNFAVAVAIDVEMAGSPETIGVHISKIFAMYVPYCLALSLNWALITVEVRAGQIV